MKRTLDEVKTAKKVTLDLLKTFVDQIGNLTKLPSNLVKMSVHSRLIERGEKGESKVLIDKKGMSKPSGERNYNRHDGQDDNFGRGRGRGGRGRGDNYNNRGGGRGGRGGWETRAPVQEPIHDDMWRAQQDELQKRMNRLAAENMAQARMDKNDIQKVRLKLNQITPDNLDKKISELREMLIGDRKLLTE